MTIETVADYAAILDEKLSDQDSFGLVCYSARDGVTQLSSDAVRSIFPVNFYCVSQRSCFDWTKGHDFLTCKKIQARKIL